MRSLIVVLLSLLVLQGCASSDSTYARHTGCDVFHYNMMRACPDSASCSDLAQLYFSCVRRYGGLKSYESQSEDY